ncbi:MAG: hypothetical protein HS117_22760 [Verrucomicrobiaceae bacterium]|nr:hypothetical protein [Verrucomicrobiaceae bacterium]
MNTNTTTSKDISPKTTVIGAGLRTTNHNETFIRTKTSHRRARSKAAPAAILRTILLAV